MKFVESVTKVWLISDLPPEDRPDIYKVYLVARIRHILKKDGKWYHYITEKVLNRDIEEERKRE